MLCVLHFHQVFVVQELVSHAARMIADLGLHSGQVLDLCCGSGAIILSLLHRFPQVLHLNV